jgi:ketosteroid isomerase-like protein
VVVDASASLRKRSVWQNLHYICHLYEVVQFHTLLWVVAVSAWGKHAGRSIRGSRKTMNSSEVVKSFYKILASDGLAALDLVEASAQWTEMFPGYAGTSIGPEAIRRNLFEPLSREWDPFAVKPDSFVADGSIVVAFGKYTGTYKATGKSISAPFVHRWEVADGRVTSFRQYTDTALIGEALT